MRVGRGLEKRSERRSYRVDAIVHLRGSVVLLLKVVRPRIEQNFQMLNSATQPPGLNLHLLSLNFQSPGHLTQPTRSNFQPLTGNFYRMQASHHRRSGNFHRINPGNHRINLNFLPICHKMSGFRQICWLSSVGRRCRAAVPVRLANQQVCPTKFPLAETCENHLNQPQPSTMN